MSPSYSLSLSARGQGSVGEMTMLLSDAFQLVAEAAKGGRGKDGKLRHGTILLIDEADALAQSRELAQMHHEDRAGVNALIRGIDGLRRNGLPVLTIMCTNRLSALIWVSVAGLRLLSTSPDRTPRAERQCCAARSRARP